MSSFLTIFMLVLLLAAAGLCAVLVLRIASTMQLPHGNSWPYAQRRFGARGRGLLRELGGTGRE